MKLYATIKNERGGKKSTGDDTRILVELSYKNKVVGKLGLYAITGTDLKGNEVSGYRIVWKDETGRNEVIREEELTECNHYYTNRDTGLCLRCGYNTLHLTNKELKGKS